jgi:hypothetical protein
MEQLQQKVKCEINCRTLRNYFTSGYYLKFWEYYPDDKIGQESLLLKRLLSKYSPYTILEAIDIFLRNTTKDKAVITYFSTSKVFNSKFRNLIKIDDIVKYKRYFTFYEEDTTVVGELLQEYSSYVNANSLSQEELDRKDEIIKLLERIDIKRAERFRRACNIVDQGSEDL